MVCFDADPRADPPPGAAGLAGARARARRTDPSNAGRQRFTDARADLSGCDVVYVAPDVPTDDQGASDVSGIDGTDRRRRRDHGPDAIMVVLSQVPPGYTRGARRPAAPAALLPGRNPGLRPSGRAGDKARADHRRLRRPGGSARSALRAPCSMHSDARSCPCATKARSWRRSRSIAVSLRPSRSAIRLAELCERIGADWSEIAPALKLDRRIGALCLSHARSRHRGRQSRARSCHGRNACPTPTARKRA